MAQARRAWLEQTQSEYFLITTEEGPWQQFARTHKVGVVVPGRVIATRVHVGAFVRVGEGIEGLVHISELAGRRVEIPEQVVQVGDEIFVKIIDIDLDRRRISMSLKQANESVADLSDEEFDPTIYGMPAEYDAQGNYEYPEGFDSETGEWLPGFDEQRETWERQYVEARARFEAHRKQIEEARRSEIGLAEGDRASGTDRVPVSEPYERVFRRVINHRKQEMEPYDLEAGAQRLTTWMNAEHDTDVAPPPEHPPT